MFNSQEFQNIIHDCSQAFKILGIKNTYTLEKNGLEDDAKRIAVKYRETVERNYIKTGILWEKYNAKTGEVGTAKDSTAHPMLGWTAAIYQYLGEKLNNTVIGKE